jgi:hypothetical protein
MSQHIVRKVIHGTVTRQSGKICFVLIVGLGNRYPRQLLMFLCQVLILYTVIVVSIYNLTVQSQNSTSWTALLSSCLGYLLPSPTIKTKHVLPDSDDLTIFFYFHIDFMIDFAETHVEFILEFRPVCSLSMALMILLECLIRYSTVPCYNDEFRPWK